MLPLSWEYWYSTLQQYGYTPQQEQSDDDSLDAEIKFDTHRIVQWYRSGWIDIVDAIARLYQVGYPNSVAVDILNGAA